MRRFVRGCVQWSKPVVIVVVYVYLSALLDNTLTSTGVV